MPRFVILEHDHPFLHWDLMLEAGDVLRTWRLFAIPQTGKLIPAEASFDHRPFYLDYEGPVSGNRGRVVRWDAGHYEIKQQSETNLLFELQGSRLAGLAELKTESERWQFSIKDDPDLP